MTTIVTIPETNATTAQGRPASPHGRGKKERRTLRRRA
jgi:hypothetical protein